MNETIKIEEAEHFLVEMQARHDNRKVFECSLSAFLSSGRSVLQYALNEAKRKKGGTAWYDGVMNGSRILAFLKGQRNLSIHERPIQPRSTYQIPTQCRLDLGGSVEVSINKEGIEVTTLAQAGDAPQTKRIPDSGSSGITVEYRFADWSGPENVLTLCQEYLDQLKRCIADGRSKGFLTS